ncbi:MAG: PIN domain-containing protein [Armatimonadaceae bacterium]
MTSPGTLADTGAIIAMIDERDPNHARCVGVLGLLTPPFLTTWCVVTETMYLLFAIGGIQAQNRLWSHLKDGRLHIVELTTDHWASMEVTMNRYADRPCDLADASLIALAEETGIRTAYTIDSDFLIYVLSDGSTLNPVPGPLRR